MKVVTLIAESAATALEQVHARFGPRAVVLKIKPAPSPAEPAAVASQRVEVIAGVPAGEPVPVPDTKAQAVNDILRRVTELNRQLPSSRENPAPPAVAKNLGESAASRKPPHAVPDANPAGEWRVAKALEAFGLLPQYAKRVEEELRTVHRAKPPESLDDQLVLAGTVLTGRWRKPPPASAQSAPPVHVFIGAPGAGKTTCLSKWLSQAVLLEERSACVWRVDGRKANASESLSVYAEILGVPVYRSWDGPPLPKADTHFVDLPGVDWRDDTAVRELGVIIEVLQPAQVHLVLNAAYEMPLLLGQIEAFSTLPVRDVIFAHLDEEERWGKLWNFVLGTNIVIGFLSAGQNVPGDFFEAIPERLLPAKSPANKRISAAAAAS